MKLPIGLNHYWAKRVEASYWHDWEGLLLLIVAGVVLAVLAWFALQHEFVYLFLFAGFSALVCFAFVPFDLLLIYLGRRKKAAADPNGRNE